MALASLCNEALTAGRAPALARPVYAVATATSPALLSPHCLFSSTASDNTARASSEGEANRRDVTVNDHPRRGGRWAWRDLRDFVPFRLVDGLGHALSHVTENLSRPLERLAPSRLLGLMKEDEQRYQLRFEVPGLGKDDVRVTVQDSVLVIQGEKKDVDDDGWWSASSYGYYHTSLLLPDDAKVDGVTAEVKDGVSYVTIPRTAEKKSINEVKVQ